jgi:hypothetical protein
VVVVIFANTEKVDRLIKNVIVALPICVVDEDRIANNTAVALFETMTKKGHRDRSIVMVL